MLMQPMKHTVQHLLNHLGRPLNPVAAIHQHLRLHNRHHPLALAHRRITGQHFGIGGQPQGGGIVIGNGVHLPPLGEPRPLFFITLQAPR